MQHIPSIQDIQYFIEVIDNLISRRPKSDGAQLPVILFASQESELADKVVAGYVSRLKAKDESVLVPHALVTKKAASEYPYVALLEDIASQLKANMPKRMGSLHFPQFRMVSAALRARPRGASLDDRADNLQDQLVKKYGLPKWFKGLGGVRFETTQNWSSTMFMFGFNLVMLPIIELRKWRIANGPRLQWFNKEVKDLTGSGSHNFFESAVQLLELAKDEANTPVVEKILTLALVKDLQEATRSTFFSAKRSHRVSPFVVFLPSSQYNESPVAKRFAQMVATINGEVKESPLLIIGATQKSIPKDIAAEELSLEQATQLFDMDGRPLLQTSGIIAARIEADAPVNDSVAKLWLLSHRYVFPKYHFSDSKKPLTALACFLVAGVVGAGAFLWSPGVVDAAKSCDIKQLQSKDNSNYSESIGIAWGNDTECTFSPETADIEKTIYQQNADVLKKDGQYIKVVFLSPLSVPRNNNGEIQDGRTNQSALWQLQGIAQAQRDINNAASNGGVRVQILLANSGDQLQYGPEVAKQVGELAKTDTKIVGVAGISQSREVARQMIRTLSNDYSLTVMGSTLTADNMLEPDAAHSYMVAANNSRQAAILASFVHNQPLMGTSYYYSKNVARNAVVITDDDDEYAYNLAAKFRQSFSNSNHKVLKIINFPVNGDDDRLPVASLHDQQTAAMQETIWTPTGVAQRICDPNSGLGFDPSKDVIFYASRSQEFGGILTALKTAGCGDKITVVGGSDLAQFHDFDNVNYSFIKDRLYYAAFAAGNNPNNDSTIKDVLAAYKEQHAGKQLNESDFARAYDALNVFGVVGRLLKEDKLEITKGAVAIYLSNKQVAFPGASGYIELGMTNKNGVQKQLRLPPNKPVLVLKAGNDPDVLLSCGRFSRDNEVTTWGSYYNSFSCPKD